MAKITEMVAGKEVYISEEANECGRNILARVIGRVNKNVYVQPLTQCDDCNCGRRNPCYVSFKYIKDRKEIDHG